MKGYNLPIILFRNIDAKKLQLDLDEILCAAGGMETFRMCDADSEISGYNFAQRGGAIVIIPQKETELETVMVKNKITNTEKNYSGSLHFLGFKYDGSYNKLYEAIENYIDITSNDKQ